MKTIRSFKVEKLQGFVFETREEMGKFAAHDIAWMMKAMLSSKSTINVMFAAAPSQNDMLKALIMDPAIDWTRVNAFHMDEYIGLTAEAPQGFGNFLRTAIFGKKPFASVNFIDATATNAQQEALRYEQVLKENPLDICLLGVGENGHIAFNDPPVADFHDSRLVKVVELEERCRLQQVNDGCFNSIDEVPAHALTVTIPALLSASTMFCVVPNKRKAKAISTMLYDSVSISCPASILRTHESAKLYLDDDAASMIKF